MNQYTDVRLNRSRYEFFRWFGFDQFEPERAVTSYWVSSKVFLGIRILTVLYSTIIMWASVAGSAIAHTFNIYFGYFTTLTFVGLHAYLVTSVYHHVRYIWSGQLDSFFKQPTALNYLYVYLYHTIITFNIVTPVVYWAVLNDAGAKPSPEVMWVNVSVHGVSLGLMLIDVIFNRMKVYTNMIILIILHVVIYMCLAFLVHAITGVWVYGFLDWSRGLSAALIYVCVGTFFMIVFFVMIGIHDLRDWIAQKTNRAPKQTISPRSMEYFALPQHVHPEEPSMSSVQQPV
ncbi:uncharacterized protein BX664DRAFT_328711 [Halteromyces radiatus]|uniref:uncharacterized protein n=1 Tax=Halteromyces radiatus TaxID=101107 RepID=UPI00221E7D4A|nr:uncharacterized protein BX664DRAFT_328711 [Halteromyces radiatus]KAI8093007.1 hypothetical protein BX664DRAFT_328711 [Halteromyces radiatus]